MVNEFSRPSEGNFRRSLIIRGTHRWWQFMKSTSLNIKGIGAAMLLSLKVAFFQVGLLILKVLESCLMIAAFAFNQQGSVDRTNSFIYQWMFSFILHVFIVKGTDGYRGRTFASPWCQIREKIREDGQHVSWGIEHFCRRIRLSVRQQSTPVSRL